MLGKQQHETFRVGDTQSEPVEVEIHNINNSHNPHLDLDNLTVSQNIEILEKEGAKDDVTVTVIMKDMNSNPSFLRKDVNSNSTLALHNHLTSYMRTVRKL